MTALRLRAGWLAWPLAVLAVLVHLGVGVLAVVEYARFGWLGSGPDELTAGTGGGWVPAATARGGTAAGGARGGGGGRGRHYEGRGSGGGRGAAEAGRPAGAGRGGSRQPDG